MNVVFDDATKEALKSSLEKRNKDAVRLAITGFGWGGPTFGVVLDEQGNEDETATIDGIKFVAEKDIAFVFDNAKVIFRKGVFGDSFAVIGANGNEGGACS